MSFQQWLIGTWWQTIQQIINAIFIIFNDYLQWKIL